MGYRCSADRFAKSSRFTTWPSFAYGFRKSLCPCGKIDGRGYFSTFLNFSRITGHDTKYPAIPQIHGLKYTLDQIFNEGVEVRHQRHSQLNDMVHSWVESKGFTLLPQKEYASKSLTCVSNNLDLDVGGFVKALREEKKLAIDGGYGKIKGQTFRISNMGNETEKSMSHLLKSMDEVLPRFLPSS